MFGWGLFLLTTNSTTDSVVELIKSSQWPPRSPDLNPCDFSLWGGLKSSVYSPKLETLKELKQNITSEVEKF